MRQGRVNSTLATLRATTKSIFACAGFKFTCLAPVRRVAEDTIGVLVRPQNRQHFVCFRRVGDGWGEVDALHPQSHPVSTDAALAPAPGSYLLLHTKHRCELLLDAPLPANISPSEAVLFDPYGGAAVSSSEVSTVAGSPEAGRSKRQKPCAQSPLRSATPGETVSTLKAPVVVPSPKRSKGQRPLERTLKRQRTRAPSPKSASPAVQTNPALQSLSPKGVGVGGFLNFLQCKRE